MSERFLQQLLSVYGGDDSKRQIGQKSTRQDMKDLAIPLTGDEKKRQQLLDQLYAITRWSKEKLLELFWYKDEIGEFICDWDKVDQFFISWEAAQSYLNKKKSKNKKCPIQSQHVQSDGHIWIDGEHFRGLK